MNSPKISIRETPYKYKHKENLLGVNLKNFNIVTDNRKDDIIYMASEISQLIAKLLLDSTLYVELSRLFKISLNKSIEFLQIIIVENLSTEDYNHERYVNKSCSLFQYFTKENFSHINFLSPSNSKVCGLDEFLTIPLKNLTVLGAELIGQPFKQLTPQILLATPTEMFWDAVPFPPRYSTIGFNNFIFSQNYYSTPDNDPANLLAIDCEMVNTGDQYDLELARVSIVRCSRNVDLKSVKGIKQWLSLSKISAYETVYDNLVKPSRKVVDYLTNYSGITEEALANVITTLADVHLMLKDLIKSNTILVGHSIQSDLKALKIYHPYIIDTSTIYNISGDFTRKPGLKSLASEILKSEIRKNGKKPGHDSVEDAQTALRLVIVKLSKDLNFGNKTRAVYNPPNSMLGVWKEVSPAVGEQSNNAKLAHVTNGSQNRVRTPTRCVLKHDESQNRLQSIERVDIQMKFDKFTLLKEHPAVVNTTDLLFRMKIAIQIIVNIHGIVGRQQYNNPCQSVIKMSTDEDVVKETIKNSQKSHAVISVLSDYSAIDESTDYRLKCQKILSVRKSINNIVNGIPNKSAVFVILPGANGIESTGKFFWKIS